MSPKVTILIPNYKTLELTKLCLRLIRQKTPRDLYKVIVIDNDSQDESLAYLRTVKWIQLIERTSVPGEKSYQAQARALDLGLQNVDTPYVVTLHTDSLVLQEDWLAYLLESIEISSNIAGVGAAKVEVYSLLTHVKKFFEWPMRCVDVLLNKKKKTAPENADSTYDHLRTYCAMYRVELLRKYGLSFLMEWKTAGKVMHQNLVDLGYDMVVLPHNILNKKIEHVRHATMVLSPQADETKSVTRSEIKRVQARLRAADAQKVLADDSLDF